MTPITREEMFLQKYGGGASGGADWNASEGEAGYVKNRTHYEETTVVNEPLNITWDGNTEGLVCVEYEDEDCAWCKVSDTTLTDEQIKLITETFSDGNSGNISDIWEDMVQNGTVTDDVVCGYQTMYVRKSGAVMFGLVFPEAGIYFYKDDYEYTTSITTTEPVAHLKSVVKKKLDEKFLPDSVIDIVFTVTNTVGGYVFSCNTPYSEVRRLLLDGYTARLVYHTYEYNSIRHHSIKSVSDNSYSLTLNFFGNGYDNAEYCHIEYGEDGYLGLVRQS